MNIKHWEQYLGPLGKTRLNLKPDSFNNVLKWDHIILPVFQRKYCWINKQLRRFWYDLLYVALDIKDLGHREHRRRHDNAHSLGKIITFEEKDKSKILVIDGQQRLTTTIIILTSIKQCLLDMDNLDDKNNLIQEINTILFRKSVPDKSGNTDCIKYEEGDSLDFVRFLPTYLDRKYFYDIIFGRDDVYKAQDDDMDDIISIASNIPNAKHFFDSEIIKYNDYDKICKIYNKLLTQFKFVYVGIPKIAGTNVQHSIYQWFFERELFIEQAGGDRPGYTQTVTDLFRNYVLSFFINESLEKQQEIYRLWISIEKSYKNILDLNARIISLINTKHLKPYDLYRDLVKFIEGKLKKYQEEQYKAFMEEFIKYLFNRDENMLLVWGYLRGIKDNVKISHQLVGVICKYTLRVDDDDRDGEELDEMEEPETMDTIESKISKKMKVIKF